MLGIIRYIIQREKTKLQKMLFKPNFIKPLQGFLPGVSFQPPAGAGGYSYRAVSCFERVLVL